MAQFCADLRAYACQNKLIAEYSHAYQLRFRQAGGRKKACSNSHRTFAAAAMPLINGPWQKRAQDVKSFSSVSNCRHKFRHDLLLVTLQM